MAFEDGALKRLARYRREADETLKLSREAEAATRSFATRLFDGLERVAGLARRSGFEVSAESGEEAIRLDLFAGEEAGAGVFFKLLSGAAAETDEDLMHEELSRYTLNSAGYSGRILGWTPQTGDAPCQTFAVYRDGVWRTKGLLVEKSRGRTDDPDEILDGFCLRIIGRLVDLAAPTTGSGRYWETSGLSPEEVESLPLCRTRWMK